MKNTKNYKLLQPAQTEYYNVDEFNENMDKLDTIISQHYTELSNANKTRKSEIDAIRTYNALGGAGPTTGKTNLSINLSSVDWSKWHQVVIEVSSPVTARAYVTANNKRGNWRDDEGGGSCALLEPAPDITRAYALGVIEGTVGTIVLEVHQNQSGLVNARCYGEAIFSIGSDSLRWNQLTAITLSQWSSVWPSSGLKMTAWGIR